MLFIGTTKTRLRCCLLSRSELVREGRRGGFLQLLHDCPKIIPREVRRFQSFKDRFKYGGSSAPFLLLNRFPAALKNSETSKTCETICLACMLALVIGFRLTAAFRVQPPTTPMTSTSRKKLLKPLC